ncbi:MAG TPA: branched-chain amino acid ABC transporter permease, partial [Anaerolineaceae bacterium]|nr:branched-chain amino acid ABC transporter permease [Anaerolineaceae bacterium]
MKLKRNTILTIIALLVIVVLLYFAESSLNPYYKRILNLCAIYSIFSVTFNL